MVVLSLILLIISELLFSKAFDKYNPLCLVLSFVFLIAGIFLFSTWRNLGGM